MTSGTRKYGVLPPAVELIKLEQGGLNHEEIADKYGVSRQAVSVKIQRFLNRANPEGKLLPWVVAEEHQRSTVFDGAWKWAKWKIHGKEVTPEEKREALLLEQVANDLNAVLVYDREVGFQWRSRRRGDTAIIASE